MAVGTAVRLSYSLGLHNEASWSTGCTFYERTYRQRVFWSLFCLSPIVSHYAGVTDLMQEWKFDVNYPKCVDDRMLYPRCPPLEELPKASPVPYLLEVIKWAKLSSDIWRLVFGPGARSSLEAEDLSRVDEKVKSLSTEAPVFLQWERLMADEDQDYNPPFRWQQALILYLRERTLRLLLRRNDMLNRQFDTRTAQTCIEIATGVVTAVELARRLSFAKRTSHYTLILHLTQALVPMICIIARPNINEALAQPAIDVFTRLLEIIKDSAPKHPFARRTLRQLERAIRTASEVISLRWPHCAPDSELIPKSSQRGAGAKDVDPPYLPPERESWADFGPMLAPVQGEVGIPALPDDLMLWDDCFGTRDSFGAWHAGQLAL